MSNQIVISSGAKVRNLSGVLTGTSGVVNSLGINVPSGIPQLDGSGKILVSQLPNSVMEFKGTWNAATNTPTLVNGTGNAGDVYLCNVAGTVNFGAGPITFAIGDQVLYSGTTWERASGATGTVTSVAVTESGDALSITGSPITTSGTINIGFAGTSGQYVNGAGGLTTFPSLTGFVPYTGATSDVNLGTFGLLGDYIGFNTSPTSVPTTLGTLSWDSFYRTLQLIDGDGDTTLQIGQEQRALIHNNTGSTLTDGQVVYVTGSTGNLPSVALASNAIEATSSVTFGVVTETIANGADGFVTISGMVNGLNTLAFNEGDALYLGATAGTFTNVKPTAPANLVLIGYIIKKAGGNGSIFVKIQNGYELEELHDVSVTSVANNEGIFWDSATSLWKNKTIAAALGYTPADDSLVVKLAGTQTITGTKTFSADPIITSTTSAYLKINSATGNTSSVAFTVNNTNVGFIDVNASQFSFRNYVSNQFRFVDGFMSNGGILAMPSASLQTYTFPASSGTVALTSDLSSYVTLATAQTISGLKKNDASILLKDGAAISTTSGYLALNFVKSAAQSSLYLTSDTSFTSALHFVNTNSYNYTFPAASGTIALTSNLSSYVPYTGATANVELGNYRVIAGSIFATPTSGEAQINFKQTTTGNTIYDGHSSIWSTGTNLYIATSAPSSTSKSFYFNLGSLTSGTTRNYTLPDTNGTLALTSDLSGYLPLTGGSLSGQLSILRGSGTGLDVASDLVIFRASTGFGSPRQITLAAGNGPTTYLEAKGYGGNYITDFGIRTYNSSGTAFEVFFATSAGNVGIGNTAPAAKLDVNGSFKATGAATFSSSVTALGGILANGYTQGTSGQNLEIGYVSGSNLYAINAINRTSGLYDKPFYIDAQKILINTGSGGNVGIGTSSPLYNLHIAKSTSENAFIGVGQGSANGDRQLRLGFGGNGSHTYASIQGTRYNTADDVNIAMQVGGGNVGIGTSSPSQKLEVYGVARLTNASATSQYLDLYTSSAISYFNAYSNSAIYTAFQHIYQTEGTERMRITSSGQVLIGQTVASGGTNGIYFRPGIESGIIVTNDIALQLSRLGSTGDIQSFYTGSTRVGTISVSGSSTSYNTTSDYRLKQDLQDYNGLSLLSAIKTYNYEWKSDNTRAFGVLAHELAEVLPYAVMGEKDGEKMQGVDYSKIVPILIKSIQELEARIKQLENK